MLYDLIIRDALVIDGSNRPGVRTDVAISDARIQRIGSLIETRAREEVNAAGRVLAPGFIDVHTHDDTVVIRKPEMLPKISQGVTTVIVGNCGISAAANPPRPDESARRCGGVRLSALRPTIAPPWTTPGPP